VRYYIIAGERSGDLHGSNLLKSLKLQDDQMIARCWGGEYMQKNGAELAVHYKEIAFMGFLEVIRNLNILYKYIQFCKKDLLAFNPDALILIDFAGFNMRIAKFAKAHGIKVFYYISPKVWAWNQSRALKIKKNVDRMFVILPFEQEFYKKYDYKVDFVGNPLLDAIREHRQNLNFLAENNLVEKQIIAVLPGSRKQEIEIILPVMMKIISLFPEYEFVVAGVSTFSEKYDEYLSDNSVKVIYDQTYDLLLNAHGAIVTSGTATLETALFEIPQVVCYKTSNFSYQIAKFVIKVPYISLVNLIAGEELVKELIQSDLNTQNLKKELELILEGERREKILEGYKKLKNKLGKTKASENLARLIVKYLNSDQLTVDSKL
jgi:lipid-A-disaccharide synthase